MTNDLKEHERLRLPFGLSYRNAALAIFVPIVALWILLLGLYICKFSTSLSEKQEHWGQFGDYLGGILNPALGTLTLLVVAFTIRVQGRLFAQQQEGLSQVRIGQAADQAAARHRRVEETVFLLMGAIERRAEKTYLELAIDRVNTIRGRNTRYRQLVLGEGNPKRYFGVDAFHAFLSVVDAEIEFFVRRGDYPGEEAAKRHELLKNIWVEFDYALGPLMRQVVFVLETCESYGKTFATDSKILDGLTDPNALAALILRSLTTEQLQCFALYAYSTAVGPETKRLARSFDVLKDVPKDSLVRDYL